MMIGQMHNKEELVKLLELHLDHPLVSEARVAPIQP